jgi:hypothetical protein
MMVSKNKIWAYGKGMNAGNILVHLQNGVHIILEKSAKANFSNYFKIAASNVYVLSQGFTESECLDILKKGANIIINNTWDEAEINSLIKKGKNKVIVIGSEISKEQLLVFANKGALVVLDHSISLLDLDNFLAQPHKNCLIRVDHFKIPDLLLFLKKGATLILNDTLSEHEIHELKIAGKDRIIINTSEEIWTIHH